jgi:hypothetical protein
MQQADAPNVTEFVTLERWKTAAAPSIVSYYEISGPN